MGSSTFSCDTGKFGSASLKTVYLIWATNHDRSAGCSEWRAGCRESPAWHPWAGRATTLLSWYNSRSSASPWNGARDRGDACVNVRAFRRNVDWLNDLETEKQEWVLCEIHPMRRQCLGCAESRVITRKLELRTENAMMLSIRGTVMESFNGVSSCKLYCYRRHVLQVTGLRCCCSLRGRQCKVFFFHDNCRPHIANETKRTHQSLGWEDKPSEFNRIGAKRVPSISFAHSLFKHLPSRKFDDGEQLK